MSKTKSRKVIKNLQLQMLRIQQGVWHKKGRVIIVFEGMDASGKGGAIRKITEELDPRGVRVHPIGPPSPEEQGKHWLYRFWMNLPSRGIISIFDRSWYGRVLVERVDRLAPRSAWQRAYQEINQFEAMLKNDGIHIIKFYLKISKAEQLRRFESRLNDPYKQWKLTEADLLARKQWDSYTAAVKDMIQKTSQIPWTVVETDDKNEARELVFQKVTSELGHFQQWLEKEARSHDQKALARQLKQLF